MSNNTNKNPLELAIEELQRIKEEVLRSRNEMEYVAIEIKTQTDSFKKLSEDIKADLSKMDKAFADNISVYKAANSNLKQEFDKTLSSLKSDIQTSFQNLGDIHLDLNDKDRSSLRDTKEQIKRHSKFVYYVIGVIVLLFMITGLSGYFATQFYKTSVHTKTEARDAFLNQLKSNNEIIVDKDQWNALYNERDMIKQWAKSNPKDSDSYVTFRNGLLSGNPKAKLFKNLNNDKIVGD